MVEQNNKDLTRGSLLARSVGYNLVGQGLPILVALFVIPILITNLGTNRFGILTLAWTIIGYFTMFDLGLGRALTKLVSERLGQGEYEELPALIWTASILMMFLGVIGAIFLGLLTPTLVYRIFHVPDNLQGEALQTFYLLAASIPIVISTTGFRGVLEAKQRFDLTNSVRIPMGIFMLVGPMVALPFTHKLSWITLVLVIVRVVAWIVFIALCFRVLPSIKKGISIRPMLVKHLLKFGGWMTISNIISPMLVYLDRFLIGAFISVTAVAYYSTPWEMVTKLSIIPAALSQVLFPAFSASFDRDPQRNEFLYRRGLRYTFMIMYPLTLFVITFSKEGLLLWLGSEFAEQSFRVLQLLAMGVLISGIGAIPFAFIQGVGRPDITAKIHLIEMLFYIPCVWFLIANYQITGAALAWMLRAGLDAVILMLVSNGLLVDRTKRPGKHKVQMVIIIVTLVAATFMIPIAIKIALFIATLIAFAAIGWREVISAEEHTFFAAKLKTFLKCFYLF